MAEVEAVRSNDLLGQVFSRITTSKGGWAKLCSQLLMEGIACQVFPAHVTEQLLDGEKMVAESHECGHSSSYCHPTFKVDECSWSGVSQSSFRISSASRVCRLKLAQLSSSSCSTGSAVQAKFILHHIDEGLGDELLFAECMLYLTHWQTSMECTRWIPSATVKAKSHVLLFLKIPRPRQVILLSTSPTTVS